MRVLYFSACFSRCSKASFDSGLHVPGFCNADDWAVARADCDFGFIAVLFHDQNHFGLELIS